ncbi:MAG TPA: copper chaperone PCu(A)C [Caulobacteraceae bacterium]
MVTKGFAALTGPLAAKFGHFTEAFLPALGIAALCTAVSAIQVAAATRPLAVSHAWIRSIGPATPAAGYFTLSNDSARSRVLVGASSPDCGTLMMHQSRNMNGVEAMVMVAQRIVPAHGRIVFAPGGFHLMCQSPSKAVRPGARIPVTLRFSDGRNLRTFFPVRPPTALGGD